MADRYWVGGSGTWNASNTSNWSASSGGVSGASVPTSSDNVIFNANSNALAGTFTVNVDTTVNCLNFTASGLDGAMTLRIADSNDLLNVYGDFSVPSSNFQTSETGGGIVFKSTSTGKTINTSGVTFTFNITFDGVGGEWSLLSNLISERIVTLTNGSFNANGYNITSRNFVSANSNARTLTLGTGTHTFTSTVTPWDLSTTTNLTFNAGTGNIVLSSSGVTFSGGGLTYTKVTISGSLTFVGANTFNELASTAVSNHTITFPNTTTTINKLSINGTATAVVTFRRTGASGSFTLNKASAGVFEDKDYFSISNGNATPANTWYMGLTSTNGGGNTGFIFTRQPRVGNFFSFIYR